MENAGDTLASLDAPVRVVVIECTCSEQVGCGRASHAIRHGFLPSVNDTIGRRAKWHACTRSLFR